MKQFLLVAIGLLIGTLAFAQPDGKERIKELKRAYISEKLNLSEADEQSFWPIFDKHEAAKDQIEREIKRDLRFIKDGYDVINEEQLRTKMEKITRNRKTIADMDQQLLLDCMSLLGAQKSAQLLGAEDEFKREVLKRLRDERKGMEPRGRR